jgi:hypothetical protein
LQKQCRWPSESPAKARAHRAAAPPPPKTHHTTRFRPPGAAIHRCRPSAIDADFLQSTQTFCNRRRLSAIDMGPGLRRGAVRLRRTAYALVSRRLGRPGGHSEGQNTRSHPELGRENPQRRWYCASRRGRVGRRQTRQTAQPKFSSSVHVRSCDGPALRGIGCHCADQTRLMTKRAAASSRNAPKPISSQRAGRAWARRAPSGAT